MENPDTPKSPKPEDAVVDRLFFPTIATYVEISVSQRQTAVHPFSENTLERAINRVDRIIALTEEDQRILHRTISERLVDDKDRSLAFIEFTPYVGN